MKQTDPWDQTLQDLKRYKRESKEESRAASSFDVDSILSDVLKKTEQKERHSDTAPQPRQLCQYVPEKSPEIEEMVVQLQELKDEVRQLRTQIELQSKNTESSGKGMATEKFSLEDMSDYFEFAPNIQKETDQLSSEETGTVKKTKKSPKKSWVSDLIFYACIVVVIFGALLVRFSSNGRPINIAGYSAFTVLTSSMEDVIPKGSLVITKSVDADTLEIGDDITYMSGPTSTITHRIIGITEKYAGTGERAFETQGVMNKQPDKNLVPAVNVVGKVIYHNKTVGDIATFVKSNWPILLFAFVVIIVLFYVLERVLKNDEPETDKRQRSKAKGRRR